MQPPWQPRFLTHKYNSTADEHSLRPVRFWFCAALSLAPPLAPLQWCDAALWGTESGSTEITPFMGQMAKGE